MLFLSPEKISGLQTWLCRETAFIGFGVFAIGPFSIARFQSKSNCPADSSNLHFRRPTPLPNWVGLRRAKHEFRKNDKYEFRKKDYTFQSRTKINHWKLSAFAHASSKLSVESFWFRIMRSNLGGGGWWLPRPPQTYIKKTMTAHSVSCRRSINSLKNLNWAKHESRNSMTR